MYCAYDYVNTHELFLKQRCKQINHVELEDHLTEFISSHLTLQLSMQRDVHSAKCGARVYPYRGPSS